MFYWRDERAKFSEKNESEQSQDSQHESGESGARIRYARLCLGAARTPLLVWRVRRRWRLERLVEDRKRKDCRRAWWRVASVHLACGCYVTRVRERDR